MSENTKLWDMLGRTDPKHTQQFKRGGGFKGTAIRPIWSFRRMTEEFGPCGKGWGVGEPVFQVVPGINNEVMVYCTTSIWYSIENDGEFTNNHVVYGVGGDKIVSHVRAHEQYNRPERWENDDEAFKKAYTDAITNALKLIGVGADVHMGLFDDSKYVASMRDEFSDAPAQQPATTTQGRTPGYHKNGVRTARSLKQPDPATGLSIWDEFMKDLWQCDTQNSITKLAMTWSGIAEKGSWPEAWKEQLREEMHKRLAEIKAATVLEAG